MTQKIEQTGFNAPRQPKDDWAKKLYPKYDLPVDASLEQVEPVAKALLSNPLTVIEGAELVLGRRIDAQEMTKDDGVSLLPFVVQLQTSKDRFGALLIQVDIERRKSEKQ